MIRKLAAGAFLLTLVVASANVGAASPPSLGPGMVGPLHPPIVDTDGDGTPSAGDTPILLFRSTGSPIVSLSYPGGCGTPLITLSNMVGGKYQTLSISRPGKLQTISILTSMAGRPTQWSYNETTHSSPLTGQGGVLDLNGDGVADSFNGGGTGMSFNLNFLFRSTTNHPYGDYATLPWSQLNALGVLGNCMIGGKNPMVFIPMADTNSDGVPDSVVVDSDGDGVADPDLPPGPVISSATQPLDGISAGAIPTFSQGALLAVAFALAVAGWMQLRKGSSLL